MTASVTVSTAAGSLASFAYTRNDLGNLTTTATTGINQPDEAYGYTGRDELSRVNTASYTYDPAGNPTTLGTGATLTYDAANQPAQFTRGGTTTPITYDNQGNRLTGPAPAIGTSTYTWNQSKRLTAANGTTFTYDASGLRASRTPTAGSAETYTWDTTRSVPLMLSDGSNHYVYDGAGHPIEQIDGGGNVLFYQPDQYGSTRLLTDQTGAVAASYTYDANGNLTTKTGTADTPLRWNGQTQDTDTGMYYLRARYYDPATAQFLSADPLAAITKAIYTYAGNNSLNGADPMGLVSVGLCANGAIGAILGIFGEACGVIAVDDRNGNVTLGTTRSLGGGMQTPTANVNGGLQISDARTVDQLGGLFGYGGLSAQEVFHGGWTVFGGTCPDAPSGAVIGMEYSGGLAPPGLPLEVHMGASYTWTTTNLSFNLSKWFQ